MADKETLLRKSEGVLRKLRDVADQARELGDTAAYEEVHQCIDETLTMQEFLR